MSTVKILGGAPEQRAALHGRLSDGRWKDAFLEELTGPHDVDEVWLVHVESKPEYSNALSDSTAPPRSVLWVPQGSSPLPFDEWWEEFSVQLLESRPEDGALLARVARCPQVLDWAERVTDVPEPWFAALSGSPRQLPAERLPFTAEDQLHLQQCEDCRAQVYDLLQQQAEIHWAVSCPDTAAIGQWLESALPQPTLETHLSGCGLCRETVRQQARLWGEAGLISPTVANEKLSAVGLAARSVATRAAPFLSALVTWEQSARSSVSGLAALLTQGLSSGLALRTATRSSSAPVSDTTLSLADLTDRLEWGEPVTYAGGEHWLHVTLDGEDVLIRVGRGPANRFRDFSVLFSHGESAVTRIEAAAGVARITPDHLAAARQAGADRVEVITATTEEKGR